MSKRKCSSINSKNEEEEHKKFSISFDAMKLIKNYCNCSSVAAIVMRHIRCVSKNFFFSLTSFTFNKLYRIKKRASHAHVSPMNLINYDYFMIN